MLLDDLDDFTGINPRVPEPSAQVDLCEAWREYKQDTENMSRVTINLPLMKRWQAIMNLCDWARFWSVRHPSADGRVTFDQARVKFEAVALEIGESAQRYLQKRGIEVFPRRKDGGNGKEA